MFEIPSVGSYLLIGEACVECQGEGIKLNPDNGDFSECKCVPLLGMKNKPEKCQITSVSIMSTDHRFISQIALTLTQVKIPPSDREDL